jgi:hypothetical protein
MSAHRFLVEIDGEVLHGLLFATASDLEAFILGRALVGVPVARAPPQPSDPDEARQGRPSFDDLIAHAVASLGPRLAARGSIAERARCVLRFLAATVAPADLPRRRTVETFLAETQKLTQKTRSAL